MDIRTDTGSVIRITKQSDGQEFVRIENTHGVVEVTLPAWGTPGGVLMSQHMQAGCETVLATVESSLDIHHLADNCCGSHNTEVIR